MVFSFFSKKPPEKMVARPTAVPRPSARGKVSASSAGAVDEAADQTADQAADRAREENRRKSADAGGNSVAAVPEPVVEDSSVIDFDNFVFSESLPDFHVEEDIDPVDAKAEEVAVLFANAQDDAAHDVLDNAVRVHQSGPGERLWFMLFDFYRVCGKKAAFETLGIDYAKTFEKSPPGWRDKSKPLHKGREAAAGNLLFSGELTGDNDAAFDAIRRSLTKNSRLRLDMSRITRLDVDGCGHLLALLQQARKSKCALELLGREALGALVEKQVESGRAEAEACWLLLLELCQLQGRLEAFEDVAINYAITFEMSPPSWEAARVAAPEPVVPLKLVAAQTQDGEAAEAYVLRDEIKSARFADLLPFAELHDPVVIDCEALMRIDFISAGALLNVLTTIRRNGRQIVFRHPNYLIAELFVVVGLKAVATIVLARN